MRLRLILATCAEPPPLYRACARDALAELRAAELRFTRDGILGVLLAVTIAYGRGMRRHAPMAE